MMARWTPLARACHASNKHRIISMNDVTAPPYSLWQLARHMLALRIWGFGGLVALVGYMYRDLVEQRHSITEADYKEGMTLAGLVIYDALYAWCRSCQAESHRGPPPAARPPR
jgi:hypothetical protein